jgi:hypothetical protein
MMAMTPEGRRDFAKNANLTALSWMERLAPVAGIVDEAASARRPRP